MCRASGERRPSVSRKILGVGLAVVGVALIATGIGAPLGTIALGAGLGSISVATVVGMGLMVASSMLMGPAVPKMPGSLQDGGRQRLHASLDLRAPRKIVFGETAAAADVRYQTFTGTKQEYLHQVIALASHKVNSIYELWLDNEKAWSSATGVTSKFSGYLTVATMLEGASNGGFAIDANWGTAASLTGCAQLHARYKLTGNTDKAQSPFSGGVTSRVTIRVQGALVYDPRLDSTVSGGAGAHRADTQATWAWSDNGSRNPALQLLWYLLGWEINSKLALGMGLPPARLDLPSFITAANICDESVTMNGGGTEPRYRADGVLSEADDRQAVVEALCACMNAVLRDSGGKLAVHVLKDDLAAPVASFDDDDVLGSMDWQQTPDISTTFNITRGTRTDPSDNALYQPTEYAEVKLTSPDGIDRIDTFDLPLVHSNGQSQRLAKQRLQRGQYQGRLSLNGSSKWWQVSVGDIVQFSHQTFGWSNKLFRLAAQKISRTGETEVLLLEENAAIYAWANDESPAVTAAAPTVYDPANSPIVQGIGDAGTTAEWPNVTDPLGTRPANNATVNIVTHSATAPAVPINGDIWVDTSVTPNLTKVRVAGVWQSAATLGADLATNVTNANLDNIAETGTRRHFTDPEKTKLTGVEAGATLGAAWATNLTGRPTELTDGRVAGAIDFNTEVGGRIKAAANLFTSGVVGVKNASTASLSADPTSITVVAHDRRTPGVLGVNLVSYGGGTISGLSSSTEYFVYCEDSMMGGGSVTWLATTNFESIADVVSYVFVGKITTPASGTSTGTYGGLPAGGGGTVYP